MSTFALTNRDRILSFSGEQIGHADNRDPGRTQLRWTEVDIYKTTGGTYVVHKIGKSLVYHGGPNICGKVGGDLVSVRTLDNEIITPPTRAGWDDLIECPVCKPGDLIDLTDSAVLRVETDRGEAATAPTPQGLVEAAHSYSEEQGGLRFLTKTAEKALTAASSVDPALADVFLVERIA